MKDLLVLLTHLLTTIAKLLGPGGARAIVAESPLMKQRLSVINRSRQRAPNLTALDRFLLGFRSLFLDPRRLRRAAVIIKPLFYRVTNGKSDSLLDSGGDRYADSDKRNRCSYQSGTDRVMT